MAIGSVFAHFQIIQKIGGGNTGVVYKAFDPMHHRFLAIKILPNDFLTSKEKRVRFMREIKAATVLSHKALASLYEVGETDGTPYIAMEYVNGYSYKKIIRKYKDGLEIRRFYKLMLPVLSGIAYAHEEGLVHRDLKPDNLKVNKMGQPKVLDFGLVKFMDKHSSGSESYETMAGMVLGSAGYMSPEQAQGEALDARSDIFSLGIIMYELLSGRNPFEGRSPFDTIVKIINSAPLSLELRRPEAPIGVCKIIGKCLEKDMNARYSNARQLFHALTEVKDK